MQILIGKNSHAARFEKKPILKTGLEKSEKENWHWEFLTFLFLIPIPNSETAVLLLPVLKFFKKYLDETYLPICPARMVNFQLERLPKSIRNTR